MIIYHGVDHVSLNYTATLHNVHSVKFELAIKLSVLDGTDKLNCEVRLIFDNY